MKPSWMRGFEGCGNAWSIPRPVMTSPHRKSVAQAPQGGGPAGGVGGGGDLLMAGLLSEVGSLPLPVHRGGSAFAYLSRAILAQQISVAALPRVQPPGR